MIIAGWGKKAKELAFVGIHKCPKCKNHVPMYLYELANRISLYFIPVAKFNKKNYLVCSLCENGFEIDEERKNIFLQASTELPDSTQVLLVWKELGNRLKEKVASYQEGQPCPMDQVVEDLLGLYPEDTIYYVVECAEAMILDEDRPR